jgi:hypothetical protein
VKERENGQLATAVLLLVTNDSRLYRFRELTRQAHELHGWVADSKGRPVYFVSYTSGRGR